MAMVTSFKFQDLIPAGKTSRHPDGAHTGLRSTTHHPDQVNIWGHAFDELGHFYFKFSGCAERS